MIAYHIDREKRLKKEQVIQLNQISSGDARFIQYINDLFPQGISVAGNIYSSDIEFSKESDCYQRVKEIEFEYIRRLYFPQKPSRFQCFFALEYQDIYAWIQTFHLDKERNSFIIWELNVDNDEYVSKHDVSWRDRRYHKNDDLNKHFLSAWEYYMDGIEYWQGKTSPDPLPELLIPLINCKVTIRKQAEIV
jgi:hypothetical protein